MKKLIAPLALLGLLYTGAAKAEKIPFSKVDDGRPKVTETLDNFNNKGSKHYLDVKTSLHITDHKIMPSGMDYAEFASNIDVPPMDFASENMDKLYDLIIGLNTYTGIDISSDSKAEAKLRYGIRLDNGNELHFEGGFEGGMAYKFKGCEEITWGMLGKGPDGFAAHFSGEQEIIKGALYFDNIMQARLVKPYNFFNIKLKPFIGAGYKRRFLIYDKVTLDEYVGSNDDVNKGRYKGWGNGIYLDSGIVADFSILEPKTKPKLGIAVENLGVMLYDENSESNLNIGTDPVTFNIGIRLTPKDLFDITNQIKLVGTNPEYRVEIGKKFKRFELALFGRINELTLAGFKRHSGNIFFSYTGNFFDMGFYLSYDSNKKVGFGTLISFHLEE